MPLQGNPSSKMSKRSITFSNQESIGKVNFFREEFLPESGVEALGEVSVPEYANVELDVYEDAELSSLLELKANDIQSLIVSGSFTDQDARYLSRLSGLELLDLTSTDIGDRGVGEALSHLSSLISLSLAWTHVTSNGLSKLTECKTLEDLQLMGLKFQKGDLRFLEKLPNLLSLDLTESSISDQDFSDVCKSSHLKTLLISETRLSDAGTSDIDKLTNLEELFAPHTSLGDRTLAGLGKLKQLEYLNLASTKITDAGLKSLEESNLTQLILAHTNLHDKAMESIGKIKSLRHLDLEETRISSDGLAHLADLPELLYLNLSRTRVDDQMSTHIGKLSTLERLGLRGCKVSDKCLAQIKHDNPSLVLFVQ